MRIQPLVPSSVMWPNEIENLLHLKEGSLEIQDNVVPIIKLKSKLNRDEE